MSVDPVTQGIRRGAAAFGFLKAWNRNRKERRAQRKGEGMAIDLGTRTSTNAMVGGGILAQVYVQAVSLIPGEGALETLLLQPESIAFFAVVLAAVIARVSKTPATPGKL